MLKYVDWIACVLLVIGGLNWGLFGFLHFNLVSAIFGESMGAQVIYGLITVSAIYQIFCCRKMQGTCR